jgi:hypothetical protein
VIRLQNSNKVVIVDEKDFAKCIQIKWRLNHKGYAKAGNGIGLMHRFILNGKLDKNPEFTVHHRNSNKLDNRRGNMMVLSVEEHIVKHLRTRTASFGNSN